MDQMQVRPVFDLLILLDFAHLVRFGTVVLSWIYIDLHRVSINLSSNFHRFLRLVFAVKCKRGNK